MNEFYPHPFKPLRVKNKVFCNRIFCSPVGMIGFTPAGSPTQEMITYYGEKARGGAALVNYRRHPRGCLIRSQRGAYAWTGYHAARNIGCI